MKSFFPHLVLLALIAFGSTVALGGNAGDRLNSPVSVGQGQSTSLKVLFDEGRGVSNASVIVSASGAAMQFTNDGGHLVSLPTITDTLVTVTGTATLTNKTMDGGSNTFTNLPATGITGQVSVPHGGTGDSSFTSNAVVIGNGAGALAVVSNNGTATNEFLTQSSSGAPVFATIVPGDLPLATAATQGAVSITTQTFAGAKTFNGEVLVSGSSPASTYATTVPSIDMSKNTSIVDSAFFGSTANFTPGVLGSGSNSTASIGIGYYFDGSGSKRYASSQHLSNVQLGYGVINFATDTSTPVADTVATTSNILTLSSTAVTANQSLDAAGGFTADSAAYASGSVPGIVSTTTQTFAGGKTFSSQTTFSGGINNTAGSTGGPAYSFSASADGMYDKSANVQLGFAVNSALAGYLTSNGLAIGNVSATNTPHACVVRTSIVTASSATASCSAGEIATGGGANATLNIQQSSPGGGSTSTPPTSWNCALSGSQTFTCYAVCCQY